ncbi:MAG: helix-turn-helix domain-containing protein [Candidatus Bathyarchaeia archaeon]|jgi:putative transcriptional regulator
MAHGGREHLETAEALLQQAGFTVSQPCTSRPSCFDFAARREENLIFIKIQSDIGNMSLNDSQELGEIARNFSAASLLIGEEAREKPLEDDTIYKRHDILAVTARTFENVVLHNIRPLIQASPGGYYVEIDGEALKQRRQKMGLSVGEMADMVGMSRRTVYGYERGLAKASVSAAYNLIWTLGIPVAKPVDIFQESRTRRKQCILTTARRVFAKSKFLNMILRRLAPLHVTSVKKAPFDFVLNVPEQKVQIIGGVANDKEQELNRRVDEILSVSKIVKAHPILITETQGHREKDIPCISSEEFSKIKGPEDLIANFKQAPSDANLFHP